MIQFSIIIPFYNCYERLKKCLESFEKQTFKNFEIIIIDDCSKKEEYKKIERYKKLSKLDIKIIKNNKNIGQGLSRNKGIQLARGKYLTFIDADDYIENSALDEINKIIDETLSDCIIFDYFIQTHNNKIMQKSYLKDNKGAIDVKEALIHSTGSTWGKVYLTENIKNKVEFPDLRTFEDMVFNKLAISKCKKIYYYNKNLYYYVLHKDSIMGSQKYLSIEDAKKAIKILEENMKKTFFKEFKIIFLKEYLYAITVILVKKKVKTNRILEHIKECEKKFLNLYDQKNIKYMTVFQRWSIYLIKRKYIKLLILIIKVKEYIKRILSIK